MARCVEHACDVCVCADALPLLPLLAPLEREEERERERERRGEEGGASCAHSAYTHDRKQRAYGKGMTVSEREKEEKAEEPVGLSQCALCMHR